jgi:SNF2 family DNA or RNA helicase
MSLVHYLHTQLGHRGPFLVIAPLSTIPHWQREFDGWTEMNTLVYHGYVVSGKFKMYLRGMFL